MKVLLFLLSILSTSLVYAKDTEETIPGEGPEPPPIGNFGVPFPQQMGPLVSFGQNIIGKNVTQLFLFGDDFAGVKQHYVDLIPGVVYGISDNFSAFLNVPYAASYQDGSAHSSGLSDTSLQLEYAYYANNTSSYYTQGTIVGTVSAPTGSVNKDPATGYGAPAFFLGTTWSRMYVDWYYFTSYGANLPTTGHHQRFGNEYYYQGGVGRNITNTKDWMFAWMVEADGQYTNKAKYHGVTDPDSGGNIVYLTPSLWASSKRAIVQLGVGVPVTQHWYGDQKRQNYLLVANIGWSFY